MKKFWEIRVMDSLNLRFTKLVPYHQMSEAGAITATKAILAQDLTPDEIISCFVNRRKGKFIQSGLFEVHHDRAKYCLSIGDNPHATIRVVDIKDQALEAQTCPSTS